MDVLLYGTDRLATDVFQAQGLLKPAVVGLDAPAPLGQVNCRAIRKSRESAKLDFGKSSKSGNSGN